MRLFYKSSFVYNSLQRRRDAGNEIEVSSSSVQNDLRPVRQAPNDLVNMAITNLLTRRANDNGLGRQQLDNRQQRRRQVQQQHRQLVSIHTHTHTYTAYTHTYTYTHTRTVISINSIN